MRKAIIVLALLLVGQSALAEYTLSVIAYSNVTGAEEVIGYNQSDNLASCSYNMGVIGGTWWANGRIGTVIQQYIQTDLMASLSFFAKAEEGGTEEWLMVMRCYPTEKDV